MDEEQIRGVYAGVSALMERVRVSFEQPTDEIALLAETTYALVTRERGAWRWHQGQLEKLVAALNDHRRKRSGHPNTTMWLMIALHDIAGLVEPLERVPEALREAADESRVELLLAELRTWRQV